MSISDAEFQLWAETPGKIRCALFELTFLGNGGGVGAEFTTRIANMPYVSSATDTPPHAIWEECVLDIPSFTRRMGELLTGRSTQSYSDLIVVNKDGERDDWLRMNWDGRRIRQWLGDPSWDFADFRLVLDGLIVDVFDPGNATIGFKLSDKGALLDRPVMTTLLGGTGTQAGDLMPLALGWTMRGIAPKLTDEVEHIYRISAVDSGGLIEYLNAAEINVYEDGVYLGVSGDLLVSAVAATSLFNYPGHGFTEHWRVKLVNGGGGVAPAPLSFNTNYWVTAEGLTGDYFKLSLTRGGPAVSLSSDASGTIMVLGYGWTMLADSGSFQLAGNTAGAITANIFGLTVNGSVMNKPGQVINQVLTSGITNTPFTSADIDSASLTSFNTACATSLVGVYLTERKTFAELFDELVISVGGWWGFSRAGLLQFGVLELPAETPIVYSFVADDIALRSMHQLRRILPRTEIKLVADKIWSPLTYVAGSVSELDRPSFMGTGTVYTGQATTTTWDSDPANHKRAPSPEPIETLLVSGVQTEADRVATLLQYTTGIYQFETHQAVFLLKLGDLIYVESRKYTGYATIVGLSEKLKGRSLVEFFCQIPDIYPTGDLL